MLLRWVSSLVQQHTLGDVKQKQKLKGENISIPQNKSWQISTTVKWKQHRNKLLGVCTI